MDMMCVCVCTKRKKLVPPPLLYFDDPEGTVSVEYVAAAR